MPRFMDGEGFADGADDETLARDGVVLSLIIALGDDDPEVQADALLALESCASDCEDWARASHAKEVLSEYVPGMLPKFDASRN